MHLRLGRFELILRVKPKKFKRKDLINIYFTRQQLRQKVTGFLKCACNDHPEIPKALIGSMAKRIINQIFAVNGIPEHMIEDC